MDAMAPPPAHALEVAKSQLPALSELPCVRGCSGPFPVPIVPHFTLQKTKPAPGQPTRVPIGVGVVSPQASRRYLCLLGIFGQISCGLLRVF